MFFRKIHKFLRLPGKEKKILVNCIWLLIKTSILIEFFPMKWIKPMLGKPVNKETKESNIMYEKETIKLITNNIRRAIKLIPWKIKCYSQALVGKIMLKRHKINSYLYLGLNKDEQKLTAHAWLRANNQVIIGNSNIEQFRVINVFN